MGLDMYLNAERFLWGGGYDHPDNEVADKVGVVTGAPGRPNSVKCEVGYWRKANAIHAWFVKNCQEGVDECQEVCVSKEKLQELHDLCKRVLEVARVVDGKISTGYAIGANGERIDHFVDGKIVENSDEVAALLPTQSGFFFGGTGYDEWYIRDVEQTIDILEKALQIDTTQWSISYRASW